MQEFPLSNSLGRILGRVLGRWLLVTSLGTVALLVIGYFMPRQWGNPPQKPCAVTIYISGNYFHTNLTVPVQTEDINWREELNLRQLGRDRREDYRYLSFGWGDRAFYLNTPTLQDVRLSTTLRAFLLPTDTVLHIQGHPTLPQSSEGYRVQPVRLSREGYLRLTEFLLDTFARDRVGKIALVRESHRDRGSFYRARGRYWLFRTCNDWTAAGLRIAGANTPLWSGLAPAIFHHARDGCQP